MVSDPRCLPHWLLYSIPTDATRLLSLPSVFPPTTWLSWEKLVWTNPCDACNSISALPLCLCGVLASNGVIRGLRKLDWRDSAPLLYELGGSYATLGLRGLVLKHLGDLFDSWGYSYLDTHLSPDSQVIRSCARGDMDSQPWDSKRVRVTVSEKSMSVSSESLALSVSEDAQKTSRREWETYGLMAPIVDFTAKGPKPNSKPHPLLSQLLRDGPSRVLTDENSSDARSSEKTLFRWIHVPVNKMDWAQVILHL